MQTVDPYGFTGADVNQIISLLRSHPCSETLDQLFSKKHYPMSVLNQLRREDFRFASEKTITTFIKRFLDRYYDTCCKKNPLVKALRRSLVQIEPIPLALQCYFMTSPLLVRAFERKMELPETGNYYTCVHNFQSKLYTRGVTRYDPQSFPHAVKWGHIEVIENILREYPPSDVIFESAIKNAIIRGHTHIVELLLRSRQYDINTILLAATEGKNFELMERMLREGAHLEAGVWATAAGRSGSIDIVKYVLARISAPPPYHRVLGGASARMRLSVFQYIASEYPLEMEASYAWVNNAPLLQLNAARLRWCQLHNTPVEYVDDIQVLQEYGSTLDPLTLQTLLVSSMDQWNYDLFDALLPIYLKYRTTDNFPENIIHTNARYFFNRLIHLSFTSTSIEEAMLTSVKSTVDPYFFEQLVLRHPITDHRILSWSVSHDRQDVFDYIYTNASDEIRIEACKVAAFHGKYVYFRQLFVGHLRTTAHASAIMDFLRIRVGQPRLCKKILMDVCAARNSVVPSSTGITCLIRIYPTETDISKCLPVLAQLNKDYIHTWIASIIISRSETIKIEVVAQILAHPFITVDMLVGGLREMYANPMRPHITAPRVRHILSLGDTIPIIAQLLPRIKIEYGYDENNVPVQINRFEII